MIAKNCGIEELLKRSDRKKLVCFGAGTYLGWICRIFEVLSFFDRIDYILDNNPEKQGIYYEFNEKKKLVSAPEDCFSKEDNLIIVITTMYFWEIFESLNRDKRLDNTECYIFTLLSQKQLEYRFPSHEGKIQKIPKKIHYCWFGGKPLPDVYKSYIETWREHCRDYEIIEWNENNYDITKNRYMYQAYQSQKWGFVPDFARLDIVYNHGGIYLDTDVEMIKSFDDLLYDEAFCGLEIEDVVNFGLGFGAVKGFRLIGEMMEVYEGSSFVNADGSLNQVPSPHYQTKILKKYGFSAIAEIQNINGMIVYPTDVLSPKNYLSGFIGITNNTHSIHHYDGTWLSNGEREKTDRFATEIRKFLKMAGMEESL